MTAISELSRKLRQTFQSVAGASLLSLLIEGQPVPASRPRVSRYGTYYAKTYLGWIKDSWRYVDQLKSTPSDAPMIVMIECVFAKAKTSKLTHPLPDVDNLAKGPLDQITKLAKESNRGIWKDDKQVVALTVLKRFAEPGETPGFYLTYQELPCPENK